MRKLSIIAAVLVLFIIISCAKKAETIYIVDREIISMTIHNIEGLVCFDCHGVENPVEAAGIDGCLSCHANTVDNKFHGPDIDAKGYGIEKEYIEGGKLRKAAMHDSHIGDVRCTVCHTSHTTPGLLLCNNCHTFEVSIR